MNSFRDSKDKITEWSQDNFALGKKERKRKREKKNKEGEKNKEGKEG